MLAGVHPQQHDHHADGDTGSVLFGRHVAVAHRQLAGHSCPDPSAPTLPPWTRSRSPDKGTPPSSSTPTPTSRRRTSAARVARRGLLP